MKRKYADRANWRRVLDRRFDVAYVTSPEFTGPLTRLSILQVTEPLWIELGGDCYVVADAGYTWLQHFPEESLFAMTTIFDAQGTVVEHYLDVCARSGIDDRGVPWWDDLYLDVVVKPPHETFVLDADELDDALNADAISVAEHELAWLETRRLLDDIEHGELLLLQLAADHVHGCFNHP